MATRLLAEVEERLVRCVQAGEELDLTAEGPGTDEDETKAWGRTEPCARQVPGLGCGRPRESLVGTEVL
jgi:hypothetical protein